MYVDLYEHDRIIICEKYAVFEEPQLFSQRCMSCLDIHRSPEINSASKAAVRVFRNCVNKCRN